jgi:hypothetical protein
MKKGDEDTKDGKGKKSFFFFLYSMGHGVVVMQGGKFVSMPQTFPLISWSGPLLHVSSYTAQIWICG